VPGSWDRLGQSSTPEQPDAPEISRELLRESSRTADGSEPLDRSGTDDPPPRWSRADLQQRLERLPPGHPSSPQCDEPEPRLPSDAMDTHRDDRPEARPDDEPEAPKRDYWSETPAFLRAAEDHLRRWPQEHQTTAVDRSRDPAGSWRGEGNQYLSPESHMQAKDEISKIQIAEKMITGDMRLTEHETLCRGWLEGLDRRLKGDDRLKEKVAEKLEHEPGKAVDAALHQISDAIRYTFCFETTRYSDGYLDVKSRLEQREYQMIYCRNHWPDDLGYKGINTRWVSPEGQRFEIQFHTAESFNAKQQATHWSYERLRNPLTTDAERAELRSYQREVSSWISAPDGATAIENFPSKGST
jgi:hypothetical protein